MISSYTHSILPFFLMFLTMSEKLSSFLSCFTSWMVRGMRMVRGASHVSINLSTELTRLRECVRLSISLHTRLKEREELEMKVKHTKSIVRHSA